jgi:predicted ABC-type ATPase
MPVAGRKPRPFLFVLAGVDGAGKSSVGGALLAEHGLAWFDPDGYARELVANLHLGQTEANARAWAEGRDRLQAAIAGRTNHAFETTLGGSTISVLLRAAAETHDVIMLYCGLSTMEQHIQRVALRVAGGGHAIDEARIRERWTTSRANLIRLLPWLAHLQVFDNSREAAPGARIPSPALVLETVHGKILLPAIDDAAALRAMPGWARPIVQAAIEQQRRTVDQS